MELGVAMKSPRILVVEDESVVALDIQKQLESLGYADVSAVRSADRALAIASASPLDLALLDIHIDGPMDGVELGKVLRTKYDTPIVYLTAFADSTTIHRAKHTEPYGYLIKPVDQRELRSAVAMALHKHKMEKDQQEAESKARELEKQLLQAQKMDAIGKLTAGIAHELNNALLTVMGNIGLAKNYGGDDSRVDERLQLALKGCERSAALIRQLMGFARQGFYRPERVEFQEVIQEAIGFLSPILEKNVDLKFEPGHERLLVTIDRGQFHQVIANLVINAQQAMPNGGRISMTCGKSYVEEPSHRNPEAVPGNYVTLRIEDQGEGIDPGNIDRVFEPFFTTKSKAQGTGLGLSVVYGIMQRHLGWITLESELGKGTIATLSLPESSSLEAFVPKQEEELVRKPPHGRGSILVIDDEVTLVDVVCRYLEEFGYTTTGFSDPLKAVDWYKDNSEEVDVIILDMKMPKMDGSAAFTRLRAIHKGARVFLFSGYSQDEAVERVLKAGAEGFFHKPIDFDQLLHRLGEILGPVPAEAH